MFLTPSKAIQLREIFRGLDFDNSGGISIVEIEEAIQYVAKAGAGLKNAKQISSFFKTMDSDGNGTIDFGEFLLAMSLDQGNSDQSKVMKKAFQDFATMHRRQTILESIQDKSGPDARRYKEFTKLFAQVPAPREETFMRAEDMYKYMTNEAKEEKKLIGPKHRKLRLLEIKRAKTALLATHRAGYYCALY